MALKDISAPFNIENEEEVRFAISQYFAELDFELTEMSFEDHFYIHLGKTSIKLDNDYRGGVKKCIARGYSDILLKRNDVPVAIIEVKRANHRIDEEDAWQAISYARLLKGRVAPFAIVTTGIETKIYDVLANTDDIKDMEIQEPTDSGWYKEGQNLPSINDDLKFIASRKLIGINPRTLEAFCANQIMTEMDDLKGSKNENKVFIPELYTERKLADDEFQKWLTIELPGFAVIGSSGLGKTNFMCANAEKISKDHFVLFYSAKFISKSLCEAVANDFVWEFNKERSITHIVNRVNDIAETHKKLFVIFFDGIDQYNGDLIILRNEIRNFLKSIRNTSVRLCISCKSYDWEKFILDNSQTYNSIAMLTYPHDEKDISARNVGLWLQPFSDTELDKAFQKYSINYSLQGELKGSTRVYCQEPLNLRLLSEAYRSTNNKLPGNITRIEFFNHFWSRKIQSILSKQDILLAERIIFLLADEIVIKDKVEILEHQFLRLLDNNLATSPIYDQVFRIGLLTRAERNGDSYIRIPFEKFFLYIYTIKSHRWPFLDDNKKIIEIRNSLNTRFGREAILFFLNNIESNWLVWLIDTQFDLFVKLIDILDQTSEKCTHLIDCNDDELGVQIIKRTEKYVQSYNKLRKKINNLSNKLLPYTSGNAGLWLYEHFWGYRTVTEKFKNEVILLKSQQFSDLISDNPSEKIINEILPVWEFYQGGLFDNLIDKLPEVASFNLFSEQISTLVFKGFLNEIDCPKILSERITNLLTIKPSFRLNGLPSYPIWQEIGYSSYDEVLKDSCEDIELSVSALIESWLQSLKKTKGPLRRWYLTNIKILFALTLYLAQLKIYSDTLTLPSKEFNNIYSYLFHGDKLQEAKAEVRKYIDSLFESYKLLLRSNFHNIFSSFPTYTNQKKSLIVEVSSDRFAFIWLPSAPEGLLEIRFVDPINKPLGKMIYDNNDIYVGIQSKDGAAISYLEPRVFNNIRHVSKFITVKYYADILVETMFDGKLYSEPNAIINCVDRIFENSLTKLSYQLIENELPHVFGSSFEKIFKNYQFSTSISGSNQMDFDFLVNIIFDRFPRRMHLGSITHDHVSSNLNWNKLSSSYNN